MKKIICVFLSFLILCLSLAALGSVSATAANGIISLTPDKQQYEVGETFSVTVTMDSANPIYGFHGFLTFNSDAIQFVSGKSASLKHGTNNVVEILPAEDISTGTNAVKRVSYKITFKAIAEGQTTFDFEATGITVVNQKREEEKVAAGGVKRSVIAATSSETSSEVSSENTAADASLKSLTVSKATLSPAFSAGQTGYTATVENDVTEVTVKAKATQSGAKVQGTGKYPLDEGSNKITVTVTAEDGATSRTYSINITRKAAEESSEPTDPTDTPIDLTKPVINGKTYTVKSDLSALNVPSGFTLATALLGETEVGVLKDDSEKYTIFYLTDDETGSSDLFTLDEEAQTFIPLSYIEINGNIYIFETPDSELEAPDDFYETTLSRNNVTFKAYAYKSAKMASLYVVYCYFGGETQFYRYDKLEETIQRMPEFELVDSEEVSYDDIEEDEPTFGQKFSAMPTAGKVIILTSIVAVLCLIAVIVLIILRAKNLSILPPPNVSDDFDDYDENGESFTFEDEYIFGDEPEQPTDSGNQE